MSTIRVASAALNLKPLDFNGNYHQIKMAIREAEELGCHVLCLPELTITGYGCEDAFHSPDVWTRSMETLERILALESPMVVSVGLPVLYRNGVFNCAAIMKSGRLHGIVAKQFLPGDGLHYEPRWFKRWKRGIQVPLDLSITPDGQMTPMGDLVFNFGSYRLGVEICEDAWVASRPGAELSRRGVDLILNPSASHFAFGKFEVRKRFVVDGSRAFNVAYVYSNLVGCEAGRVLYDGTCLIASGGKLLTQGRRFSLRDREMTVADVDLDHNRMLQARTPSFEPDLEPSSLQWIHCGKDRLRQSEIKLKKPEVEEWEKSSDTKEHEFTRAVTMGLADYLFKSRAQGYALSMSGGADSGSCAILISLMMQRLKKELKGCYKERKYYLSEKKISDVLNCVYQGTRQSSGKTREMAKALASELKAEFVCLDVEPIVNQYLKLLKEPFGRDLSWDSDDLALQNIQARVRSPGIWLLANLRNLVLISTGNRSEAAVGYCTMDGDTSGGLAPLGGVDKCFVLGWLDWISKKQSADWSPVKSAKKILESAPTAELRPYPQSDEDDLMPYEVLGFIESKFISSKKGSVEIFHLLTREFGEKYSDQELQNWLIKFFDLFSRTQWKRERLAPCFHLDEASLDPKSWCRFPIFAGSLAPDTEHLEGEE